jgi:CRP-like cAMP-binding protein
LLVLEGFLCREASVAGRASVELLGSGDVLRPWDDSRAEAPVPVDSQHLALSDVRLAVLDRDFAEAVRPWPEVTDAICARLVDRARWLALQLAISRVRRVEDRVLVLLWHLADRWGRVQPDGTIVCPVPLTHQLVAGMISAQRPTVSTSFARLASEGRIAKHPDGWTLCGAPPSASEVEGRALADAFRLRRTD